MINACQVVLKILMTLSRVLIYLKKINKFWNKKAINSKCLNHLTPILTIVN